MMVDLSRILKIAIATGALASASLSGTATAADVTATANAEVILPITVVEDTALNFGTLALQDAATAGTVLVSPAGAATPTGVDLVPNTGLAAGTFTVSGEGSFSYAITLASTSTNLVHATDGVTTINVSGLTLNKSTGTLSGTAGTAGNDTFSTGGTLNVAANQKTGSYSGTYTVTVNYN